MLLTPRQKEILELLRDGYTAKEIASKLGISPFTVKTIITSAREKLGEGNTTHAVITAIRKGYISLDNSKGGN